MSELLARLLSAGTDPALVAEVAREMGRLEGIAEAAHAPDRAAENRRAYDRERKRAAKADRSGGNPVESAESVETPAPLVSPLSFPPDPLTNPPYNPPTPAIQVRAKASQFGEPEGVKADSWQAFRKQRKKPLTQIAYDRILKTLEDGKLAGWPPGELVDLAIERGWETVFVPKEQRNGRSANGLGGNRGSGTGHGVTVDAATSWLNRRMGAALG